MTTTTKDQTLGEHVETELLYLVKDPKHETEKPYQIAYDAKGVVPQSNISHEAHPVLIRNFRPLQNSDSFGQYGFTSMKINCPLTAAEYSDDQTVKTLYYSECEKLLWQTFPEAAAITILEHALRKRTTEVESIPQHTPPATQVHVDWTLHSADQTARAFFPDASPGYKRLVTVNVWKCFQGPGNDSPLALCDYRSIDHNSGSISIDRVYHNRFTENQAFYYSPNHEWYYFKDLESNEVIMFRQTDSDLDQGGGVAHTGFHNPDAALDAAPRESIELRAFVFFK